MRILHVNKFLYRRGGAEAYMLDLAELQRERGHQVEMFGMDHPENEPMTYAGSFPPHLEFRPAPSTLRGKAQLAGRTLYSSRARAGIDEVLADFQPDVVHVHNIYHQLSPAVLAPLARRGIPAVLTLHDYKQVCPSYQFLDHGRICEACIDGRFFRAVVRRCKDDSLGASALAAVEAYAHRLTGAYNPVDAFICPSGFLASRMEAARAFPDRLHVLRHFIDATSIEPRRAPGAYFAFAGRLSPEKGVDTLIRAAAEAPEVRVEIAGDGPERQRLEALAGELAPGRIVFHGRIDRSAVHDLMRGAVAVAVPSRWHENQPITVLEAFACATPVIGSRLGGMPELIEDRRHGLLVAPDSPAELAIAMRTLAGAPGLSAELGAAARRRVEEEFTPGRHLDELERIYAHAGERRAAA